MLAELDAPARIRSRSPTRTAGPWRAHTHVAIGYNVQVAVDTKQKLIVEQQVTNQVVDMGLLTETAEPAKEILGVERIGVVADRGYFKIEDIEACEKARMDRSEQACSARMSLDTTRKAILFFAGGSAPAPLFVIGPAWAQEDQLRQQAGVSRLPHPFAMHEQ